MTAIEFNNQLILIQQKLRSFANSLTGNRQDAQDLVQDTMLKAMTYRDKFNENTNLGAWLFTIMKNTFINNYRRNRKTNSIVDGAKDVQNVRVHDDNNNSLPETSISEKEILKGIDALDKEIKVPFQKHIEGFKYKEIAELMHLPIGTVKSRIFLARQELMSKFSAYNK